MSHANLGAELRASHDRFALIDGSTGAVDAVAECETLLRTSRCDVGRTLCSLPAPPTSDQIEALLQPHAVLVNIELLFTPMLRIDPLVLLRRLTRRTPHRVAVWPGRLAGGRASFSEPQRLDHYDEALDDVLVLRPTAPTFPDEPSFEIERWLK